MKIAVASGKGGTGKTTVAVNLSLFLVDADLKVTYADCDVEEPDGHLFLKPEITLKHRSAVLVPQVNPEACNLCGECGAFCRYSAIVVLKEEVMTFPELCHSCGGCAYVCSVQAITEVDRYIGSVDRGSAGKLNFISGCLDIGQAMGPPLIKAVLRNITDDGITIVDAPPGTSCPAMTAVGDCDYLLLVAEPTPFGRHDLELMLQAVGSLPMPRGVVLNRVSGPDTAIEKLCSRYGVPILSRIPEDRRVAEAYSKGLTAWKAVPGYKALFADLWSKIEPVAGRYTA
ncbi:MAG: ATP-binding protein [bacterium]|jgi:MinD superfamily P-loop ATPase|nr:ATP-binding protein [bacterium]MDD3805733.1 ATP-binding protein [bacterium]MDD4153707.1 ATP-binding protein [bacterium]MDD4557521.1 ATP-binding protein [bacterium]